MESMEKSHVNRATVKESKLKDESPEGEAGIGPIGKKVMQDTEDGHVPVMWDGQCGRRII